ncbi:MAG: SpoIVB peptidase S55 domain-containing protein, partial [Oscillospiraceae bacterium]
MKKIKITKFLAILLVCVLALQTAALAAERLVPGGMTVGLELKTRGIVVSRLTEVETESGMVSPAKEAGIVPGDCIIKLDGNEIGSGKEFVDYVSKLDGGEISVTLMRTEKQLQFTVTPAKSKIGVWQLGMWLRDGASGIGTVTYYDPESGKYGALGHGVNDIDNGLILPIMDGKVCRSTIMDIISGKNGCPGELCGIIDPQTELGDIETNTPFGIFGVLTSFPGKNDGVETVSDAEIKIGKA